MGEMSVRTRPRRHPVASFNRLRRMVADVKCARKSLAAHHSFMAELVSISLFSSVGSSKASSPRTPPYYMELDDLQEVGNGSMPSGRHFFCSVPPARKPTVSGPRTPTCNPDPDDLEEVGTGSPMLQIDESQDVGITSIILLCPMPCSALPVAKSLSSPILPVPLPTQSGNLSPFSCKTREEADCLGNEIITPFSQPIAVDLAGRPALWASLLLVLLCFFLFIGKELAVGLTITAYFTIWLSVKGQSVSNQISRYIAPGRFTERHFPDKEVFDQSRSCTLLTDVNDGLVGSSESHLCAMHHECAQGEIHISEPGDPSRYSPRSRPVGTLSAGLELGIMLVLALCGLAHGQIMAVCMCSCCILMFSEIQRLVSNRVDAQ